MKLQPTLTWIAGQFNILLATKIPLQINEGTSRNKWMKLFSVKMEFGELKAEAYSSLSMRNTIELNANIDIHIQ